MNGSNPSAKPAAAADPPRWSPNPLIRAIAGLHGLAAATLIIEPGLWAWVLGTLLAAHFSLAILGMLPQSGLLGPNLTRLPAFSAERGEVALTFDDGPDPLVTPRVLDILDAHGAKASFFCIGERVEAEPALTREILRRGHSVENHSHTHPLSFACSLVGGFAREVGAARDAIEAATGTSPLFFRAPMGLRNPLLDYAMHRAGQRYVSWTRRGFDGVDGNADAVLGRLTRGLRAGDILLLHDGRCARSPGGKPIVIEVLPRLLEILAARGLRAVSLPAACRSSSCANQLQSAADRPHDEAGVHPEEQHVVPQVVEMRHSALFGTEVAAGCRDVEDRKAAPYEPHGRFGIEIEPPHPGTLVHDCDQIRDRIDAEAEQAVADRSLPGFAIGPPIGDPAPAETDGRRAGVEDRLAEDDGLRPLLRSFHEGDDEVRRVLSVRIHGEDMRETASLRGFDPVKHRRALAAIDAERHHRQSRILRFHAPEGSQAVVSAAIHDDPNGRPGMARLAHRLK